MILVKILVSPKNRVLGIREDNLRPIEIIGFVLTGPIPSQF